MSEAGELSGQSAVQTPLFSYTAQRLASSADAPDQQAPYKQLSHEEVTVQSAGPLSEAGEHEGQSAVQTPLIGYAAQRLASSAEEPDQQAPYKQLRHDEVSGQSAGPLSEVGEHEG